MWIPKWIVQQWQAQIDPGSLRRLTQELHELRVKNIEIEKRALAAELTNDWLRVRLNQAEAERAMLLSRQTALPFTPPVIHPAGRETMESGIPSLMDELSFEDVGDDKARQLGLDDEAG